MEKKIMLLQSGKSSRDRYYLISSGMGGAGEASGSITHSYSVANGVDRGRGYQGYLSVPYFLKQSYCTPEAREKILEFATKNNLSI